jgi:glycosyltransferase involved in cell wall biosynthesis
MTGNSLRVLAWPAFHTRPGNPYNWQLYTHLQQQGVSVEEYSFVKLLSGDYHIFHVHWPEWQISQKSFLVSLLRFFRFMILLGLARAKGIRIIWTIHNIGLHENYHPKLGEYFYRTFVSRVDGYISLSHANVKSIESRFPRLRNRPHVVTPHGDYRAVYPNEVTKEAARSRLGISRDARVALYFGTIRTYKNIPLLIRQFRRLDNPDVLLLVVGAPATQKLEEEIVEASGGDGRIRLTLEFVKNENVQLYFNAADITVLPFLENWNSGSAILALSFNRPVLVPAIGSMSELQELVGPDWMKTFQGTLSSEILNQGFLWTTTIRAIPEAPLGGLSWKRIAGSTKEFFEVLRGQ